MLLLTDDTEIYALASQTDRYLKASWPSYRHVRIEASQKWNGKSPPQIRTSTSLVGFHHVGVPCGELVPSYIVGHVRKVFNPRELWTFELRTSELGGVIQ